MFDIAQVNLKFHAEFMAGNYFLEFFLITFFVADNFLTRHVEVTIELLRTKIIHCIVILVVFYGWLTQRRCRPCIRIQSQADQS